MSSTNCQLLPATATRHEDASSKDQHWNATSQFFDPDAEARLKHQLDSLLAMGANWDFAGAPAPSEDIVRCVKRFCNGYVSYPSPTASATIEGGVQLEWHVAGRTLEIDFSPTGETNYICWQTSVGTFKEGALHAPKIKNDVRQYAELVSELISWVKGA